MRGSRISACAVLLMAGLAGLGLSGQPERRAREFADLEREFAGERAFTMPSEDASIGFQVSTQVKQVLVVGGQAVKKDDPLVLGDDAEERALLKAQEERTKTDLPVQRQKEEHELAKVELSRVKEAKENGAATEQEVQRAEVTARIAAIEVETAEWTQAQELISLERFRSRVERYTLRAPFDGRVQLVAVDEGDSVRESDPVIKVVNTDVLHIDVPTPVSVSLTLGIKVNDPAWVLLDVPGAPEVVLGHVVEVDPVADFAARKQRIRVEIGNPRSHPAGLAAFVRFTEPPVSFEPYRVSEGEAAGG
ncbi:MAG: HlyD family efflux transporter periplasmic adaptor subunit [Phycisphaeraceae bacterium]|nr:HlyD family efflux transporter periplasmic adaptor subunit [Phycisphaeraceae bacterium]